jgi:3-oxoacyl-[acyl-carrier-protein] synthase III
MAFQHIKGSVIAGMAATVPAQKIDNTQSPVFAAPEDAVRFIENTGVAARYTTGNSGICTSDLCEDAANRLIDGLGWDRADISCIVFVSQTPDYILPATSCILQNKLGLSTACFAIDISLGCSGWVYGLSVISALMATGAHKKALLLVGDTTTVTKSAKDKSAYPLFGDAGTATALQFTGDEEGFSFHTGTDGAGYDAIMIKDGGFRNFFTTQSLDYQEYEGGLSRNNLQSYLNGPAVFTFGITKAPQSVNALLEHSQVQKEAVDYFVMHQANKMMNEKIRTKLKLAPEKVPYSLQEFGNTSSASIPLTIVSQLGEVLPGQNKMVIGCGFGVGLSWGSVLFRLNNVFIPPISTI